MANTSILKRKKILLKWVEGLQDQTILRKLENIKEGIEDENDSFILPGAPMTVKELEERLARAHDEVKNGKFISHEDLKREMDTW